MSGLIQRYYYPETSEDVQTIRKPQGALLLLDSYDRYTLDTDGLYITSTPINPNNFIINHQKNLGAGQIKRICITDVSFPWVTPNVNIRNNRFFVSDASGNDYYTTIVEDFYTSAELATALQTGLNSAQKTYPGDISSNFGGGNWTVTSNVKTNAFTIKNPTVAFSISFPDGVNEALMTLMNVNKLAVDISNNTGAVGGIPSMAYTKYIDICSRKLTKFQNLKDTLTQFNYSDIIYRLYLDNELGMQTTNTNPFSCRPCNYLYRQIKEPKFMMWNKDEMLNEIDIQLYDDSGELLYIPQNSWNLPFFLTIQMSES